MQSSKHWLSGQDAHRTQWVLEQHKKRPKAETKVALSEIEKNLQGTNSGGDEAENQINDLEHKKKAVHQNGSKKI